MVTNLASCPRSSTGHPMTEGGRLLLNSEIIAALAFTEATRTMPLYRTFTTGQAVRRAIAELDAVRMGKGSVV